MAWRRFCEGCSLRLLHPQRWFPPLAARLASLEQLFCSCVGCNAYLTPAGSKVSECCGTKVAAFSTCKNPGLHM